MVNSMLFCFTTTTKKTSKNLKRFIKTNTIPYTVSQSSLKFGSQLGFSANLFQCLFYFIFWTSWITNSTLNSAHKFCLQQNSSQSWLHINITCKVLKNTTVWTSPFRDSEVVKGPNLPVFSSATEPRLTVLMPLNWHTLTKILSTARGTF